MNREEAKYVLRAYPVNGQDCDDPQFSEALAMADHDPELRDWFERERAFDAVVARKLGTVCPPGELQTQIFAAQKVIQIPTWRSRIAWFATAAAIIMITFGLSWHRLAGDPRLALNDFHSYVVRTATTLDHLDVNTNSLAVIREWLRKGHAPNDFVVPSSFAEKRHLGCRVFDWEGKRVSLICFAVGEQKVAHMFVIERSDLSNVPANSRVAVQINQDGMATAVWTDEVNTYVVALRHGQTELRRAFL